MAKLTIGMPVYNAESYISQALESLVKQSFQDMEIIISDNASTDRTFEICRDYSHQYPMITVHRNTSNIGAAANFNLVFHMAKSEYFKWASYDDICDKEFVKRCVDVLDSNKEVVLCYTRAKKIDEHGNCVGEYSMFLNTMSDRFHERFQDLIDKRHSCIQIFGVFRSDVLKKTHLIGNYLGADRVLLGEVGLMGKIYEIPDSLFFRRDHPTTTMKMSEEERLAWFDPKQRYSKTFPNIKILFEHVKVVHNSELSNLNKCYCLKPIYVHIRRRRKYLLKDIKCFTKNLTRRNSLN